MFVMLMVKHVHLGFIWILFVCNPFQFVAIEECQLMYLHDCISAGVLNAISYGPTKCCWEPVVQHYLDGGLRLQVLVN